MKLLLLLLITFPALSWADSIGANVGVGQRTRPYYGIDYQFSLGLPYIDAAVFMNSDYVQPNLSTGLQFTHVNVGLATSLTHGQFSFGPEMGYTQNLSSLVYVKENNNFTGYPGRGFSFGATLGIGLNL